MFEKWKAKIELKNLGVVLRADEFESMCYEVFIDGKKSKLYARSCDFGRWYCHKKRKNNPFTSYDTPEEAVLNEGSIQLRKIGKEQK